MHHKLLSTEECFCILKKLADAEVFSIFFTGGEPFLRDDLPELVEYCFNVGLEARISTNAHALNENKIKRIVKTGIDHLQVSLHGPSFIHESIVGRKGSYTVVMRNLRLLIESGIRVEIACVGLKENIAHIPTLIREIAPLVLNVFEF
jgi:MoaA/NifB/PqqE/SkfB family radical SAM enzyme